MHKKIDSNTRRCLISEFIGYPSYMLHDMLHMSKVLSKTQLVDDDKVKHISQIVGNQIQKELISRN